MTSDHNTTVRDINNQIADGYDRPGSNFFLPTALKMIEHLEFQPNDNVLDVCTGTGFLALNIAEQNSSIQVTGIDIAERMVEQAIRKANNSGLSNVTFQQMDLNNLSFEDGTFDMSLCNYGIFFLEDIHHGLQQMRNKTKAGGIIAFTVYDVNAFAELVSILKAEYQTFRENLNREDVPPWKASSSAWKFLSNDESIRDLCYHIGFQEVSIHHELQGFELNKGEVWWDIIWHSTYRHILQNFMSDELALFKQKHLSTIDNLCVNRGYWVDTSSIIVICKK